MKLTETENTPKNQTKPKHKKTPKQTTKKYKLFQEWNSPTLQCNL